MPWNLEWGIQLLRAHFFSLSQKFTKVTTSQIVVRSNSMLWNVIVQASSSLRKSNVCLKDLGHSLVHLLLREVITHGWLYTRNTVSKFIICTSPVRWFPSAISSHVDIYTRVSPMTWHLWWFFSNIVALWGKRCDEKPQNQTKPNHIRLVAKESCALVPILSLKTILPWGCQVLCISAFYTIKWISLLISHMLNTVFSKLFSFIIWV